MKTSPLKKNEVTMSIPSNIMANDFNYVFKVFHVFNLTLDGTDHLFHIFLAQ